VFAVDRAAITACRAHHLRPDGWSARAYGVIRRDRGVGYRDRRHGTALHLSLTDGYELLVTGSGGSSGRSRRLRWLIPVSARAGTDSP
jgi:hypothetical protein